MLIAQLLCTFVTAVQHRGSTPDNHVALGIYEHPLPRPADSRSSTCNRSSAANTQSWK